MVSTAGKAVWTDQLRYLNTPRRVRVVTGASGAPRAVLIGRRARPVRLIRDRWRVDDTWWREPICRMYYELELDDGRILVLYHDRSADCWYQQRYGG